MLPEPVAGNQCSETEKTRMRRIPSRKLGIENPTMTKIEPR